MIQCSSTYTLMMRMMIIVITVLEITLMTPAMKIITPRCASTALAIKPSIAIIIVSYKLDDSIFLHAY